MKILLSTVYRLMLYLKKKKKQAKINMQGFSKHHHLLLITLILKIRLNSQIILRHYKRSECY